MIEIPTSVLDEIREHGRGAYPEECCGALLGRKGEPAHVVRVERIENARGEERARRYEVSPTDYLRVERLALTENLALLGFYHSHPDHPAAPSTYDRDHAFPFFHYLVCAVENGVPAEITAWTLLEESGEFEREAILEERA
ncbi:MAG: M67 family metallopeptidase [Acidobacteriota bacterium]|nr:M67 family metallopeptidase [Acidobacteriota bacterium]